VAVAKPIPAGRAFELDERQREAIDHVSGPMLVVAGAGTGKTTVLIHRIARLVRQGHARPNEILAVTYTKNAVQEIRDRVRDELRGTDVSSLQIATFHEYCNDLLGRYDMQFGVLDDQDLWIYLRKRIRELHLKYFIRPANLGQFLRDLLDFMRRCHDDLVSPEKYAEYVRKLERGEVPIPRVTKSKEVAGLSDEEVIGRCQEIASVFATVEHMLQEDNLGTFSHMITNAYSLLAEDFTLLAKERANARFILADEFQDVNFAQVKVLKQLAGEERNVFAVGDPDQAIYRFRGASSAAFTLFHRQFPETKMVVLEKNRRSTTPILKTAFALISKNPDVFPRGLGPASAYQRSALLSAREEEALRFGEAFPNLPVDTVLLTANDIECRELVTTIRQRHRQLRCQWKDFAVLYRQHSHRNELPTELAEQGVPFSIENMDVMDTPEARDLLACLGAVVAANDSVSLFRVAALPQFAIDPHQLRARMRALPRDESNAGIASVLEKIEGGSTVLELLQQTRDEIVQAAAKSKAALEIIIRRFQLNRATPPVAAVLDFVGTWETKPKSITKTGELGELLEYLDYFREAGGSICLPTRDEDAVRLMTPHAAKGLEFKHVFIIRAVSPSFPAPFKESLVEFPRELRAPDSVGEQDDKVLNEQEERRLFYVAMTRARDSLTIYSRKGKGKKDPTPPGFLRDLLKDSTLTRWLRQAEPRGFQTDMFAEAAAPLVSSRTTQWLDLPPASDLAGRLSASAVQRYDICPLQFKLERDWRIPGDVGAAMQYGASMHRLLRTFYDSVRFQRPIADDALIESFRADLAEAGLQDKYQHDLYQQQGVDQLREFLALFRQSPVPDVLQTEEWFEVKVGDVTVVGRIDRVDRLPDGTVVITDYKTGKPQSQDDADESVQLSIYALAAREKWNYRADRLVFYNLRENISVITRRSETQIQEARLKIEEVARNVAAGRFDPKPGFHCAFCAYRTLCPATEKRLFTIATDKNSNRRN
jgi:DNA helicase-2/ATP-dependent DNA helicase PcrA